MINLRELRFHHVGIVTSQLANAVRFYGELGYGASAIFADPIQKVEIVLMTRNDSPMVELIQPLPDSPASAWLTRIKAGAYHTCYSVGNLEEAILALRRQAHSVIANPAPAVAFGGKRVCFLFSMHSGLLELVEN